MPISTRACSACGSVSGVRGYPDYDDSRAVLMLCRACGADYLAWCRAYPAQDEYAPENAPSWTNDARNL